MKNTRKVDVLDSYDFDAFSDLLPGKKVSQSRYAAAEKLVNEILFAERRKLLVELAEWHDRKAIEACSGDLEDPAIRSAIVAEHFVSADYCRSLLDQDTKH